MHMEKQKLETKNDLGTLADDAHALMAATADVAGDKLGEAPRRLAAALENGKEFAGRVRTRTVAGARVADQTVRKNPYETMGLAFGVGALIGYLVSRRCSRNGD